MLFACVSLCLCVSVSLSLSSCLSLSFCHFIFLSFCLCVCLAQQCCLSRVCRAASHLGPRRATASGAPHHPMLRHAQTTGASPRASGSGSVDFEDDVDVRLSGPESDDGEAGAGAGAGAGSAAEAAGASDKAHRVRSTSLTRVASFLWKKGRLLKVWNRRYYEIRGHNLVHFKRQPAARTAPRGSVDLTTLLKVAAEPEPGKPYRFVLSLPGRRLELQALTSSTLQQWMAALAEFCPIQS